MFVRSFILGSALALASPAWSCEPLAVFHETLTPRSQFPDQTAINAFVTSNAPVVGDIYLSRGTAGQQSLCGGQGYIYITLNMPPGSPYDFTQIGFEINRISGAFPDYALPSGPVISIEGPEKSFEISGSWFEGPPRDHGPIEAEMEVSFVSPDGTKGPATRFSLISIPEKRSNTEASEGETR